MHWIKREKSQLIVKTYPLALVCIPIIFVVIATISIFMGKFEGGIIDLLIFYGVCAVFISIHFYIETIFDKEQETCTILKRNLFKREETQFLLSDINDLDIHFGRGSGVARGGTLNLSTDDKEYTTINSDIQLKHEQKVIQAKEEIERFLKS